MNPNDILERADKIVSASQIATVYDQMAADITSVLKDKKPIVLTIMNGGLVPAAALLSRFSFALELGYAHPTRYRDQTEGGELEWRVPVPERIRGRHVLIVDDILDEGVTLKAVHDRCVELGAESVNSCVLVRKRHQRCIWKAVDFVGLEVADRYVFGSGMDYQGYLRNAQGIYALSSEDA